MINYVKNITLFRKKVSNTIRKESDIELIYKKKKILRTEVKCYRHDATDFHDNEIPKDGFSYIFSAVQNN